MRKLKIALAQCRQTADFDDNAAAVFEFLDKAAAADARIVCFPETQTVGYRVDIATPDAPVEPARLDDLHQRVAQRCGELQLACILGTEIPLADNPQGKPYNSALVISEQGDILGAHHKAILTPLDAVAYSPGQGYQTYDLCGVKVGVVICFEGFRFADTTRECVRQGALLVFHPQNNTTRPNDWKIPIHHAMITTRAAENTVWFASCNLCHPLHQNCASMVVAPDGRLHAQTDLKREQLLATEIDIDLATRAMFNFDTDGCATVLFADTVAREEYARKNSP
ncbi:carbon-nitrogen hydrolase family protein [Lignipirellula cremea]|uniref:(R)-stereoselective amidase n=1 Tax=Lignipirellula cremea TaxID=2528010 RepID=A0A518DQZ8_9BACT|nr:carbon-nitrogen hydrolase family protein [Lignipirellula cremea]QDU94265.1 (R)-stereoselective amidase [Lignipirellula cremea]